MNSSFSGNFIFNINRPLKDQKNPSPSPASSTTSSNAAPNETTHQPAPAASASRSGLSNPSSMVGDFFGTSWTSAAPASGVGLPKADPNPFGDLLGSALGQGKSDGNLPLKDAAPRKTAFSTESRESPRSNVFDPFPLDVLDPFHNLTFGTSHFPSLSDFSASGETAALAGTRVDWKETPENHVFMADLPGLKKEEMKVEVEDDRVLQISGERNREVEEKCDTWHRVERSSGKFFRRFGLPENVKVDKVSAAMENGVLTVTVPKEEVRKSDVRPIQITD